MFSLKRKKKIASSNNSKKFKDDFGFTNGFGYKDTDPYLFFKSRYLVASVFDVLFDYGTHNPEEIGWICKVIPSENIHHCKLLFFEREKGVPKPKQKDIIQKKMASNLYSVDNTPETDMEQLSNNGNRSDDIKISAILAGRKDTIIDSDILMVIVSDSPEHIEQGLALIRNSYHNNNIDGITLVREVGRQYLEFRDLLSKVSADSFHSTDMSTVAADRLFFPSSGFSDEYGVSVGIDIDSLIYNNSAIIDFTGVKNAIICTGEINPIISIGGFEGAAAVKDGGSAIAQVISDGTYLSGLGRVHHIIMAGYPYNKEDSLYFDMGKKTINPMEVFGTPETVVQDANDNFDKVTEMLILVMENSNSNIDDTYIRVKLEAMLEDWFIFTAGGQGLYTTDPNNEPKKAQMILATDNHDNYPTTSDFLIKLRDNLAQANDPDSKREARLMYEAVKTAIHQYPNLFSGHTNLPNQYDKNIHNIYYDIQAYRHTPKIAGVAFLNTLAYVVNRAHQNDTIVIHGLDQLEVPLESIIPYKKIIKRKNIGLITTFEDKNSRINPNSYESFTGTMNNQDMLVIGGVSDKDDDENHKYFNINFINRSWNKNIPEKVVHELNLEQQGVFFWYRKSDQQSALIRTHLLL